MQLGEMGVDRNMTCEEGSFPPKRGLFELKKGPLWTCIGGPWSLVAYVTHMLHNIVIDAVIHFKAQS